MYLLRALHIHDTNMLFANMSIHIKSQLGQRSLYMHFIEATKKRKINKTTDNWVTATLGDLIVDFDLSQINGCYLYTNGYNIIVPALIPAPACWLCL